jgi:hypothetical protein
MVEDFEHMNNHTIAMRLHQLSEAFEPKESDDEVAIIWFKTLLEVAAYRLDLKYRRGR